MIIIKTKIKKNSACRKKSLIPTCRAAGGHNGGAAIAPSVRQQGAPGDGEREAALGRALPEPHQRRLGQLLGELWLLSPVIVGNGVKNVVAGITGKVIQEMLSNVFAGNVVAGNDVLLSLELLYYHRKSCVVMKYLCCCWSCHENICVVVSFVMKIFAFSQALAYRNTCSH